MEKDSYAPVKIRRINIRNYKGIDQLEVSFPAPKMSGDPDILIIGSENGLGKTSILECCSLLLFALTADQTYFELRNRSLTVDIPDLLIRSDHAAATIHGDIVIGDENEAATVEIRIDRSGNVNISRKLEPPFWKAFLKVQFEDEYAINNFIEEVCGLTQNPVVKNTFLLFHSYRKIREGNPQLGMMVEQGNPEKRPLSTFKLRILRSLMGKADLFEFEEGREPDKTIDKLNELLRTYAGGTISKLRASPNNTVDIRVMPTDGGESFTFDGLSSGQKEIISTLFLIWDHTWNNPSVVLIDEPELHLNAQWHRRFVKSLVSLAPHNQYIMATHSEDIMDSVDADRRLLLLSGPEDGK